MHYTRYIQSPFPKLRLRTIVKYSSLLDVSNKHCPDATSVAPASTCVVPTVGHLCSRKIGYHGRAALSGNIPCGCRKKTDCNRVSVSRQILAAVNVVYIVQGIATQLFMPTPMTNLQKFPHNQDRMCNKSCVNPSRALPRLNAFSSHLVEHPCLHVAHVFQGRHLEMWAWQRAALPCQHHHSLADLFSSLQFSTSHTLNTVKTSYRDAVREFSLSELADVCRFVRQHHSDLFA